MHGAEESRKSRQVIQSLPGLNTPISQLQHFVVSLFEDLSSLLVPYLVLVSIVLWVSFSIC